MRLKHHKLIWQIYPSYLLIIVAALTAVAIYISGALETFYLQETQRQLEAHVKLFQAMLPQPFSPEQPPPQVNALCNTFGASLGSRMTVILPSGQVVGDSMEEPLKMDNHNDRPEIQAAFANRIGISTRRSYTLNRQMMYVALPLKNGQQIVGVVRAALPVLSIQQALNLIDEKIVLGGMVIALFAAMISFGVAYWLNRPLEEIRNGAEQFASGHLQHRIYPSGSQELMQLADAMNEMAAQLHDRIDQITHQRNELEAMLASMVEAVVVVDPEERILRCNQAAGKLFDINVKAAQNRNILEVIRNAEIQRFLKATLHSEKPVEEIIEIDFEGERFLRAYGTLLKNGDHLFQGVLLVFHDITRLKQLENMRRDFVANVSHELKTPITAIKGFIETLQNGAMEDANTAPRFLEIIARNANRLDTIIDDLLALSRIEQDEEKGQIALTQDNIAEILRAAITSCAPKAQEKGIAVTLDAPETLYGNVNTDLLEQAVTNLLDNALKYSGAGSTVQVQGKQHHDQILISVKDTGCGIPAEHLPRLFERFYRVDKARSRNLGGTGLGLAIVKHIVQAHRGSVAVESVIGKGSVFTIKLPAIL